MKEPEQPSVEILYAFGAKNNPFRLAGGQGENYRSGNIILKPAKDDEETNWISEFYLRLRCNKFRLPKPIRSHLGNFVFNGWQAWEYLEGNHENEHWEEIVEIAICFHQAIAKVPQPAFFQNREQNPWVIADKVTWGEMTIEHHPKIAPAIEKLRGCLHEVKEPPQLIHGDIGGNVLFSKTLAPAIIDFSPYWRPVEFAIGVIIADAIVWEDADISLIEAGSKLSNFHQHLLRAELRRVIEIESLHQMYGWDTLGQIEAHQPFIEALRELCP